MPREQLVSRLRELCERAGVSLGWLAQETGLTLDALQKIASGRRQPLVTTALRIAEVLDVEAEELVVTKRKTRKGLGPLHQA